MTTFADPESGQMPPVGAALAPRSLAAWLTGIASGFAMFALPALAQSAELSCCINVILVLFCGAAGAMVAFVLQPSRLIMSVGLAFVIAFFGVAVGGSAGALIQYINPGDLSFMTEQMERAMAEQDTTLTPEQQRQAVKVGIQVVRIVPFVMAVAGALLAGFVTMAVTGLRNSTYQKAGSHSRST